MHISSMSTSVPGNFDLWQFFTMVLWHDYDIGIYSVSLHACMQT